MEPPRAEDRAARRRVGRALAVLACVIPLTSVACSLLFDLDYVGQADAGAPEAAVDAPLAPPDAADAGKETGTFIRVAAGASSDYTDTRGNVWKADYGFEGGRTVSENPMIAIAATEDPFLYNNQRYGIDDANAPAPFRYLFAVPDGDYTVTLKFAEVFPYITDAGERLFDVSINGNKVLPAFDIFASAGGAHVAVDRSFDVTVGGGAVVIEFDPGAVQNPKIDAIAITPR